MTQFFLIIIPVVTFCASFILLALGTYQLISPTFQFWPPPRHQPWKKAVFMVLFRIVVYGLVIVTTLEIWINGIQVFTLKNAIALTLIAIGFAIAFAATGALGWNNAFGSKEGLRTDGVFKFSRNPIYIATWFGLAGWALLVPTLLVAMTLSCWALLYMVAIFTEERWLAQEYGDDYLTYCRNVPRFL